MGAESFTYIIRIKLVKLFNKRTVLLFLFILLSLSVGYSQSRQVKKAIRKKEKSDQKLLKDYEQSREKSLKRRYDMQSDAVKDRMKIMSKKSKQWNKKRRTPFYKTIFSKNRRKKRKK